MTPLAFVAISFAFLNSCYAETLIPILNCDPSVIKRENTCKQYLKLDSELNSEYGKLIKNLSKNNVSLLKSAQREWIKWRSDHCNLAQEDSGCQYGSCVGVEHDSCILQLTFTRINELKNFKKNPEAAKSSNFQFSIETRFDDE